MDTKELREFMKDRAREYAYGERTTGIRLLATVIASLEVMLEDDIYDEEKDTRQKIIDRTKSLWRDTLSELLAERTDGNKN